MDLIVQLIQNEMKMKNYNINQMCKAIERASNQNFAYEQLKRIIDKPEKAPPATAQEKIASYFNITTNELVELARNLDHSLQEERSQIYCSNALDFVAELQAESSNTTYNKDEFYRQIISGMEKVEAEREVPELERINGPEFLQILKCFPTSTRLLYVNDAHGAKRIIGYCTLTFVEEPTINISNLTVNDVIFPHPFFVTGPHKALLSLQLNEEHILKKESLILLLNTLFSEIEELANLYSIFISELYVRTFYKDLGLYSALGFRKISKPRNSQDGILCAAEIKDFNSFFTKLKGPEYADLIKIYQNICKIYRENPYNIRINGFCEEDQTL